MGGIFEVEETEYELDFLINLQISAKNAKQFFPILDDDHCISFLNFTKKNFLSKNFGNF